MKNIKDKLNSFEMYNRLYLQNMCIKTDGFIALRRGDEK